MKNNMIIKDIVTLSEKAHKKGYIFFHRDAFALGYLTAKYKLTRLIDNEHAVLEACHEYDKTDDLGLLDTIGETLLDLNIISNNKML